MLKINVEYYNDHHHQLIQQYECAESIDRIIQHGLEVDKDEVVTYSIFKEQKNRHGWKNYHDLRKRLPERLKKIKDYYNLDGNTIQSRFSPDEAEETESLGISVGLIIMNRVFGLHEADWEKIPIVNDKKTLDYEIASNGDHFIQVETKGSIFTESPFPRRYNFKSHIEEKKADEKSHNNSHSILFGTITGFPTDSNSHTTCHILDPLPEEISEDPAKYKLLSRLHFYHKNLALISRSNILIALGNRIAAIQAVTDYNSLDGITLKTIDGYEFNTPPPSVYNRVVIEDIDYSIVGRIFPLSDREFFFFGFDIDLYQLIVFQDFSDITSFSSSLINYNMDSVVLSHDFSIEDFVDFQIPDSATIDEKNKTIRLELVGNLFPMDSGRVIGIFNCR